MIAEREQEAGPRLDQPLQALTATPGVQAGLVATDDGLPIATRLRPRQDADALSGTAAAIGRLAATAVAGLGKGELQLGVFDAEQFRLIVRPLSVGFLLVLAEPDANLGLIAGRMCSAAAAIEEIAAGISAENAAPGGVL